MNKIGQQKTQCQIKNKKEYLKSFSSKKMIPVQRNFQIKEFREIY